MIQPGVLRKDWEWIRPGIEKIRERSKAIWLAEDIYCRIMAEQAILYVDQEKTAFAIFMPIQDPYTSNPGIEIMDAYSFDPDKTDYLLSELFDLFRSKGAIFVQADSLRLGLSKKGWTTEKIVYRRTL